ncbi:MAG: hypothetical protein ACK4M6_10195 [Hyphomonas sp.]
MNLFHKSARFENSPLRVGPLLTVLFVSLSACAIVPDVSEPVATPAVKDESLPSNEAGILLKSGFEIAGVTGEYVYLKKGGLLARCQFNSAELKYSCMQVR